MRNFFYIVLFVFLGTQKALFAQTGVVIPPSAAPDTKSEESVYSSEAAKSIFHQAYQMALSGNATDQKAAEILLDGLDKQSRMVQNKTPIRSIDIRITQDFNGEMLGAKLLGGEKLSALEEQMASARELDPHDLSRQLYRNDFSGMKETLGLNQLPSLDSDQEESAISLAMNIQNKATEGDLKNVPAAVPSNDQKPEIPTQGSPSVEVVTASVGTTESIIKREPSSEGELEMMPEGQLRTLGIRRAITGLNIFDLAHRRSEYVLKSSQVQKRKIRTKGLTLPLHS